MKGFIDHLYIRLGTASTYNAIADLQTLKVTTRWIFFSLQCLHLSLLGNDSRQYKFFSFCADVVTVRRIFYNRTANWTIATSVLNFPCRTQLSTDWVAPIVFFITSLHEPSRKHRFQLWLHCCMRIRCHGNVCNDPLYRNGCTRYIKFGVKRNFLKLHIHMNLFTILMCRHRPVNCDVYIPSNNMIKKWAFLIDVISRHMSRGSEWNHGNPQSG
jgi:hypothetical protein